jgi:serine carboxypeptidase-like clade 1
MDGLFYEQGPIHFVGGPENLNLTFNPWTWVTVANMIFLEAPAGVGFSYSKTSSDYNTNDQQTALDNYTFLKNWFLAYPSFTKNPFWISGESYAGIYVPTLAQLVAADPNIFFEGIMVGNGVTDWQFDPT